MRCNRRRIIKHLAARKGRRAKDLLVLDERNDPFYVGSRAQYANAEWARELYRLLAPKGPVHIRRLHYFALAQPQHRKPNGTVYSNTTANWKFLICACKFARYLKLLPYEGFVDRRNLFDNPSGPHAEAEPYRGYCRRFVFDTMEKLCKRYMKSMMAKLMGASVEIWVEKSTAADLVAPVSEKYGINVVTSMGDISLTAVWNFIRRVSDIRKPVRIFFISDFDPAGENMPISVARKIEFLLRQYKLNKKLDIKLKPLLLTRRQCETFRLPGIPVLEKFGKNCSFAKYHGQSVVELHALEVARPGYVRQLVESRMKEYIDLSKLTCLVKATNAITSQLSCQITELIEQNANLNTISRAADKLCDQITWRHDCDPDEPWLFDSHRDYMTQLAAYQLQRLR